jgi:hypothetical protein
VSLVIALEVLVAVLVVAPWAILGVLCWRHRPALRLAGDLLAALRDLADRLRPRG